MLVDAEINSRFRVRFNLYQARPAIPYKSDEHLSPSLRRRPPDPPPPENGGLAPMARGAHSLSRGARPARPQHSAP